MADYSLIEAIKKAYSMGSAATKDVTTHPLDTTPGRLQQVGDFGNGGVVDLRNTVFTTGKPIDVAGKGRVTGLSAGNLLGITGLTAGHTGTLVVDASWTDTTGNQAFSREFKCAGRRWFQESSSNLQSWTSWQELYHTGNISTAIWGSTRNLTIGGTAYYKGLTTHTVTGDFTVPLTTDDFGIEYIVYVNTPSCTITIPKDITDSCVVNVVKIHETQGTVRIKAGPDDDFWIYSGIAKNSLGQSHIQCNSKGDNWRVIHTPIGMRLIDGWETGENANGKWTRTANRIQQCHGKVTASATVRHTDPFIHFANSFQNEGLRSFPVEYVNTSYVILGVDGGSRGAISASPHTRGLFNITFAISPSIINNGPIFWQSDGHWLLV